MYRVTSALLASLLLAGTAASAATDYPTQPITVLVPHAAGGPTDTVARLIAESMTGTLGQQLLVENAGGAGSTVGTARAARAEPDGYTLLLNHVAQASSASLYRKLSYDPDGAFDGIGRITDVPMTIVARADFAPNTIGELIEYIRANKDNVTYAHAGVGSASHLCGMLFMDAIDVADDHRPLQGHRPGDDRSSRRPGRRDVRPDHQHRAPDQDRQDQGLRGHHQGAAVGAARPAHARRVRASRASR